MEILEELQRFIDTTRDVVYLRDVDRILIIRPNKIQHLNESAYEILSLLYREGRGVRDAVDHISSRYGLSRDKTAGDVRSLVQGIRAIMKEEYGSAPVLETIPFDPGSVKYPILSEIALTYRCQNRCDFCYASSPYRGDPTSEMSTGEVKTIISKIHGEAHVPTISFTGGEPTLREDLPELVAFARDTGMRTNLITNGIRCSDSSFVRELSAAGLNSAQVSLESHDEKTHNSITGNRNAYEHTIRGIENLKAAGIYTHTNTTICDKNRDRLIPLVDFIHRSFSFPYLSMNMIITTGIARDNDNIKIGYSVIGDILRPVLEHCETIGIKFVWYSPTPYCLFNPVDHNLGSKSCACISGLLSVNPSGDVLPCSSYDRGVGNLLKHSFDHIWNSDQALYYRERRYVPPVCKSCRYGLLCGGACPLYWENAGGFGEIEEVSGRRPMVRNMIWNLERGLRLKSRGISGLKSGGR